MNDQPYSAWTDRRPLRRRSAFPITHSWSPFIHGLFAKQTDQRSRTRAWKSRRRARTSAVAEFFAAGGNGLNVTVPHKQAACLLARYRTPRAEIAGAVNTLALRDDGLLGR